MKKINEIAFRPPKSFNEQRWFSAIVCMVEEMPYGTLELKLTIKDGEVTHIKTISTKSLSIHNS